MAEEARTQRRRREAARTKMEKARAPFLAEQGKGRQAAHADESTREAVVAAYRALRGTKGCGRAEWSSKPTAGGPGSAKQRYGGVGMYDRKKNGGGRAAATLLPPFLTAGLK